MKVLNIHTRQINQSIEKVLPLFHTLSQKDDEIWPKEKWPAMKFKNGLVQGSKGGHGPIRYEVLEYRPDGYVEFKFSKPNGFNGIHKFEINSLGHDKTEIKHTIDVSTSFSGTINWFLFVKWLHDALIEDAFDKVENKFSDKRVESQWNIWVRFLRRMFAPKK